MAFTPEEQEAYNNALSEMDKCIDNDDYEVAHLNADSILTEFLLKLGCKELVEKYEQVHKWYA